MAEFLLHARILPPSGPSGKHVFLLHKSNNSTNDTDNTESEHKPTEQQDKFTDIKQNNAMNGAVPENSKKRNDMKKQRPKLKNHYE